MTDQLEEQVREKLRNIQFPGVKRDIVSFGFINDIEIEGKRARIDFRPSTSDREKVTHMEEQISEAVTSCDGIGSVVLRVEPAEENLGSEATQGAPNQFSGAGDSVDVDPREFSEDREEKLELPGVDHVIAVVSGKGGVGKSTVSVNLAEALVRQNLKVGLADLDIYGPSAPTMLGVRGQPEVDEEDRIVPLKSHGIDVMSIGFVLGDREPSIWRGPMVMQAVEEFLHNVKWGEQDVLVADLPPGTGDAQLSLMQTVSLDGVVVVTTPQILALLDVDRSVEMCNEMDAPILGIVENMSYFMCDECGKEHHIFGKGGGKEMARRLDLPYLGGLPLQPEIREGGDKGLPVVQQDPHSDIAEQFELMTEHLLRQLSAEPGKQNQ